MKRFLIKTIKFYQKNISVNQPRRCRFYPTCSAYAIEALEIHGTIKGTLLAIIRLSKCHPLSKMRVDLVPPKKEKKHENN